ncbi:uncharacterized protein LOC125666899 [Ostrea edulis]|uniref:uncharacterized protein LOC125666899 n=1 Tax=Ostrea edulis TaxID=37623 RepID=UPI0024AF1162|nr:uncharacterized protein LOC125666899 [Ostrea edulis]XP_056008059.1 uncharacterized protein LOC125666899 [Ostrea edulis]
MSDIDMMSRSDGRMASAASSFTYVPFGFTSKTQYDANESLIQIRSENYSKVEPEKDNDIWKRPPPDFRPQIFAPKPPKRNSRESMKPENFGTYPGTNKPVKRPERTVIPHMLRPKKPDEGRMILRYHIDRPFTAKKKFVTEGMYKAGEFVNPKPHDFRGYPPIKKLGLDEFVMDYDKDPYNIYFHTGRLNIIHGVPLEKATDRDIRGRQMAPPKTPDKKYDADWILPKGHWPTKPGELNRHRLRHRPAHSAFMDRVDRTLQLRWAKEKMDKEIQNTTS